MRIVIVEDDEFKQRRIAQVVSDAMPDRVVEVARSVNSGLRRIREGTPDLVLLDMSLTTFDVGPDEPGGRPQNFGGMEILRQMDRHQIVVPVIVITQHERFASGANEVHLTALHRELTQQHSHVFKGLIYYNSGAGVWEKQLRTQLRETLKPKREKNDSKSTRRRR